MEGDNFVQDIPPSLRHAIFKNAPLIVNGVNLAFGAHAANHVVMERNPDPDTFSDQRSMEEGVAPGIQRKQGIAQRMHAQLIANGMTSESGATVARIVVVVGNAGPDQ